VNILYSAARGPWRVGIGGGYAQRKYLAPTGTFFTVNGVTDESWMLQADASLRLSRVSGIDGALFANWYRSGIAGAPDVTAAGGTSSYYHSLTERLTGRASVGLYTFDIDGFESDVTGQLLLGLRYQL
jgi:hypothetical protein